MGRQLTEHALHLLNERYLMKNEDGEVIENPDDMFRRVAITISNGDKESDVMVYDEFEYDSSIAFALSKLTYSPDKPTPVGVFRSVNVNLYEEQMMQQIEENIASKGKGDLKALLAAGESWSVN